MTIISIQSHVASGHVGNSAAVYPLQRMGFDVCPVHTATLAHHPGHGGFHGALTEPGTLSAILNGLEAHGVFNRCHALLSGYLGGAESGKVLLNAWQAIRRVAPEAVFCCMPVMGDRQEGIYVDEALPDILKNAIVPEATIVVANAFELEQLSGIFVVDIDSAERAGREVMKGGPSTVIATSIPLQGKQYLGNLLIEQDHKVLAQTKVVDTPVKGTGDFFGAVWLGQYLVTGNSVEALRRANAAVRIALDTACCKNLKELPVLSAIDTCMDSDGQFPSDRTDAL